VGLHLESDAEKHGSFFYSWENGGKEEQKNKT